LSPEGGIVVIEKLKKLSRFARSYSKWFLASLSNSRFSAWNRPIIIVTGADSTHFRSLLQLLETAAKCEPLAQIVVWDLGLSTSEVHRIKENFPRHHYRVFPFREYPPYFDIAVSAGEYAWKPVAIQLTADEFIAESPSSILLWCDAGNYLRRPLRWLRMYVGKHGVYSPGSTGNLIHWTHPQTLAYFALSGKQLSRRNCAAAYVAFDLEKQEALGLLKDWSDLAQLKEVIAPEGSSRADHRQDQALLSCLLVARDILPDTAYRTNWTGEYLTHRDVEKGKVIPRRTPLIVKVFKLLLMR
jgi:hypothetical protein